MSAHDFTPPPGSDAGQITPNISPSAHPPNAGITTEPALASPQPTAPPKPHPGFWWSVLWCIGFLFVTQVPGALVAAGILVVYSLMNPAAAQAAGTADTLLASPIASVALAAAFLVTEILVISVSLLVIRLVVGRDWTRQLAVRRPSLSHVVLAVASLPGLVVLANGAYLLLKRVLPDFSKLLGLPDMMGQVTEVFTRWPWPFGVLVIGLGPGIGEELWCRGFLGRGLVGKYGVVLGVIFSSFFFGLIHVDPVQGSMAMLMGLYLHFTYLATRSLWVPMLLHFLNNSLAVLSPRFTVLEALDADPAKAPAHLFVAASALVGVVIWALYTSRARLAPQGAAGLWRPAAAGVEYPPEDSGLRVVHPLPSVWAFGLTLLAFAAFVGSCYAAMTVK